MLRRVVTIRLPFIVRFLVLIVKYGGVMARSSDFFL